MSWLKLTTGATHSAPTACDLFVEAGIKVLANALRSWTQLPQFTNLSLGKTYSRALSKTHWTQITTTSASYFITVNMLSGDDKSKCCSIIPTLCNTAQFSCSRNELHKRHNRSNPMIDGV